MAPAQRRSLSPLVIRGLVAALVAMGWLYVLERARHYRPAGEVTAPGEGRVYQWRLVTTWPRHFPGLGMVPERFAENVEQLSGGGLRIKVYGAGELVPAMGVFDDVSLGTVEMGHFTPSSWQGKVRAVPFFSTASFGT